MRLRNRAWHRVPSLSKLHLVINCKHYAAVLQGARSGEAPDAGSTQRASSSGCLESRAIRPRDLEAAKELQGMGLASPGVYSDASSCLSQQVFNRPNGRPRTISCKLLTT